jgi:hypothetical protein
MPEKVVITINICIIEITRKPYMKSRLPAKGKRNMRVITAPYNN